MGEASRAVATGHPNLCPQELRLSSSNLGSKTLGIVVHSAEGGALCFLTACRESAKRLGLLSLPKSLSEAT